VWSAVFVATAISSALASAGSTSPQTERVDIRTTGEPSQGTGILPAVSTDGRYVAFASSLNDLVPADTGGPGRSRDVFVRDRIAGTTTRVSVATDGRQGNHESDTPAISGDGRYVAFVSGASNLVPRDRNKAADVFVHDRAKHETTRVSVSSDGAEGDQGGDAYPAISADGRFVAFASSSTNLAAGATGAFVHDRQTGRTSLAAEGETPISISANGRFVGFRSILTFDDFHWGTFVRDRRTDRTVRVDVSSDERAPRRSSRGGVISANGRYVAFVSDAGQLGDGDDNGGDDVFVRDLRAGVTTRVSIKPDGKPLHRCPRRDEDGVDYVVPCAEGPVISANGRYVAFVSELRAFDRTRYGGVFLHDRRSGTTVRVVDGPWEELAISGDGRYVAFWYDGVFLRGPMH
jgi:Tol biopolymer transport system component